jgi:F0F1-type ATP synthase membrane subunit b/b'
MSSKHLATFLLGAAAGLAATKYMSMTPEEREKMIASLKEKAHKIKGEAESGFEKAKEYFEEIKAKGGDSIKEHFGDLGNMVHGLFGGEK